jgi:hypothetical protein
MTSEYDWKAAIAEFEQWLPTEITDERHLHAAIAALKEMQRREDKKASIKELMKP